MRLGQSRKAPLSIVLRRVACVRSTLLSHSESAKQSVSRVMRPAGRVTEARAEHFWKALAPMVLRVAGNPVAS